MEDLEFILEGCPWLFCRKLVLLERLTSSMNRDLIRLVRSLFWVKVDPCLPECDKKDLTHAIGLTFEGYFGQRRGATSIVLGCN